MGVTLGAQVRHLVTYPDPPEGTLIYTVFTKKCQKRCKKGVPLFLTGVLNAHINGSHFRLGGSSRPNLPSDFGHSMEGDFWACARLYTP